MRSAKSGGSFLSSSRRITLLRGKEKRRSGSSRLEHAGGGSGKGECHESNNGITFERMTESSDADGSERKKCYGKV